jgi:hypothetical protein
MNPVEERYSEKNIYFEVNLIAKESHVHLMNYKREGVSKLSTSGLPRKAAYVGNSKEFICTK